MKITTHPLWQAGFRPFFIAAAFAGLLLPLLWISFLHDLLPAPALAFLPAFSVVQWHAHEMFFGFGAATLFGFLLTASKNWVGIRGYHGSPLLTLALLWCLERLTLLFGGNVPAALFWLLNLSFIALAVAMVLHTLLTYRHQDSYRRDNIFFLVALPLLLPAKVLLLIPETFASGVLMTQGVFRLAFLLMLERTLSTFMKTGLQLEFRPTPRGDRSIKLLALLLCLSPWLDLRLCTAMELALAALMFWRLGGWHVWRGMQRLDIGIMYVGYLALLGQLLLAALDHLALWQATGTLATHVFTLGAMGCIVPAMFIRIGNGHTGRKVMFGGYEKSILWLMLFALGTRTLCTQLFPAAYGLWLDLTATGWAAAFGLWLFRFAPQLAQARIDGKPG